MEREVHQLDFHAVLGLELLNTHGTEVAPRSYVIGEHGQRHRLAHVPSLRGVLLAPLPFPNPDALVHFGNSFKGSPPGWSISPVEYRTNYATLRSFAGVGAWASAGANLTTPTEPIHVSLGLATASLLPTLGIHPAIGRWFLREEETEGADRKLVLGDALWRSRFGSDPGVMGRTVEVDGK